MTATPLNFDGDSEGPVVYDIAGNQFHTYDWATPEGLRDLIRDGEDPWDQIQARSMSHAACEAMRVWHEQTMENPGTHTVLVRIPPDCDLPPAEYDAGLPIEPTFPGQVRVYTVECHVRFSATLDLHPDPSVSKLLERPKKPRIRKK